MLPYRFVILHHLAPTGEHWDFMLEREDVLLTWQMAADPTVPEPGVIHCVRIKDHRKHYLDYEGPIGGGRGIVTRIERGSYELLAEDDTNCTVRLAGRHLRGDFHLQRPDTESNSQWIFAAT